MCVTAREKEATRRDKSKKEREKERGRMREMGVCGLKIANRLILTGVVGRCASRVWDVRAT